VADTRAVAAAACRDRPSSILADSRDDECGLLRAARRLSVAHAAGTLSTAPTVYRWFTRFRDDRTCARLNHLLVMQDRERVGREASPCAAVIDSQSVKTTEAGGPRGYDAGKRINGRKRHAMVDTDGRGLKLQVHPASVQDRDGAIPLLQASHALYSFLERAFADSAYAAERVTNATRIIVENVRKQVGQIGFPVHPRRWVVERFFAWLGRNRRLAKDFEATIASAPRSSTPLPSCPSLDG
jgi:putative transposase